MISGSLPSSILFHVLSRQRVKTNMRILPVAKRSSGLTLRENLFRHVLDIDCLGQGGRSAYVCQYDGFIFASGLVEVLLDMTFKFSIQLYLHRAVSNSLCR